MITRVVRWTFVAGLLPIALAWGQEKPIRQSDLPAPVAKTVTAQSQGATLRGLSVEKEKGQVLYEAEFLVDGRSRDVVIDAGGTVVEVEEEVVLDQLPAEVRVGLQAAAGKGKLIKVESLTKRGRLVAYEARVETAGKRSEVQVGPDGKPLAQKQ